MLPVLIVWYIWQAWNRFVFDGVLPYVAATCNLICASVRDLVRIRYPSIRKGSRIQFGSGFWNRSKE